MINRLKDLENDNFRLERKLADVNSKQWRYEQEINKDPLPFPLGTG